MNRKERADLLLKQLCNGLYEKEQTVALSLLCAVAGESIFLLGPPGVAKSMIARRMKQAFRDGKNFEYLMSRFSTPDEIFGPVSISRLKDEDKYEHITDGYLPEADVVFLDEIWKAGPSIQNTLLTVLNEKIFRNGQNTVPLPLKLLISASNELPAEGEGLEALWDRFLIRYFVNPIEDPSSFEYMITSGSSQIEAEIDKSLSFSEEEYHEWHEQSKKTAYSAGIMQTIHAIKNLINEYNQHDEREEERQPLYISDRRWKKIFGLMRTAAFINNETSIHYADCSLMMYCLWDNPDQLDDIEEIVNKGIHQGMRIGIGLEDLRQEVLRIQDDMRSFTSVKEMTDHSIKTVNSFFHQINGYSTRGRVLIYAAEYEALKMNESTMFYFSKPKNMTNTYVMKRYDRTKLLNIDPRNIIQISKGVRSVIISGTSYPLELEQDAKPLDLNHTDKDIENRIGKCIDHYQLLLDEYKRLEAEEADYINGSLFIDNRQKRALRKAFKEMRTEITDYNNEIKEIQQTYYGQG